MKCYNYTVASHVTIKWFVVTAKVVNEATILLYKHYLQFLEVAI